MCAWRSLCCHIWIATPTLHFVVWSVCWLELDYFEWCCFACCNFQKSNHHLLSSRRAQQSVRVAPFVHPFFISTPSAPATLKRGCNLIVRWLTPHSKDRQLHALDLHTPSPHRWTTLCTKQNQFLDPHKEPPQVQAPIRVRQRVNLARRRVPRRFAHTKVPAAKMPFENLSDLLGKLDIHDDAIVMDSKIRDLADYFHTVFADERTFKWVLYSDNSLFILYVLFCPHYREVFQVFNELALDDTDFAVNFAMFFSSRILDNIFQSGSRIRAEMLNVLQQNYASESFRCLVVV